VIHRWMSGRAGHIRRRPVFANGAQKLRRLEFNLDRRHVLRPFHSQLNGIARILVTIEHEATLDEMIVGVEPFYVVGRETRVVFYLVQNFVNITRVVLVQVEWSRVGLDGQIANKRGRVIVGEEKFTLGLDVAIERVDGETFVSLRQVN
jgi:hypothetical protein